MGVPRSKRWCAVHFWVGWVVPQQGHGVTDLHFISRISSANQMPKAVQKSLKTVFQKEGGVSEGEADALFERLEAEGRYQEETWS